MAFTEQEENGVRAILTAVTTSGLSPTDVARTLKLGKLTTEVAEYDAKVANAEATFAAVAKEHAAMVKALRDAQEAKRSDLRQLTGN